MKKVLFLLLVLSSCTVYPSVVYVNQAATGLNNGTSWANAYTDLEMALLLAVSGDEVWVAKGTYYTSSTNDRGSSFVINNGVKLYGNFFGNETNINQRVDLIPNELGSDRTNETILSGDIGTLNDSTDNANHVIFAIDNTLPIIINGVKVVCGNAIQTPYKGKGGGIYMENVGNVTLQNIIVAHSTATAGNEGKGAGIYAETAAAFILENSTVRRNWLIDDPAVSGSSSYSGGGIYVNCPVIQIANSFIDNNKILSSRSNSTINGGGLYIVNNLSLTISNTDFKNNIINSTNSTTSNYLYGGGLACYGITYAVCNLSQIEILQNSIVITRGNSYGAGSYFSMDTVKVSNGIVNNNQTNNTSASSGSNQGGGMYASGKKTTITNSTFNQNKIYGRYASGGGIYLSSGSTDTCQIQGSRFSSNTLQAANYYSASLLGGGLYLNTLTNFSNSMIENNTVTLSSLANASPAATSNAYGGGLATGKYLAMMSCVVDSNILQSLQVYNYNTMINDSMKALAYGGGIYSTAKLKVNNSDISYNKADAQILVYQMWTSYFRGVCYGGGIYNKFSTAGQKSLVSYSTINNNEAKTYIDLANGEVKGGGIYCNNMDILHNQVSDNETYVDLSVSGSQNQGGGIFHNGTGKLYHNHISLNTAEANTIYMSGGYSSNTYGGGVYSNSPDTISNCLIHNNRAIARNKTYGGGLYNRGASKISNVTVAENHTYSELLTRYGSGIYTNNSNAKILNSIIFFNDSLNYYDSTAISLVKNSVIQLYQSGGGNFNINPQFVDTAVNNFHVTSGSIAIDRGDSAYIPGDVHTDLDGFDRISGNNVDIGTFELDQCKNYSYVSESVCYGIPYFFNGQNLMTSGIYYDTLTNVSNCDSLVTLNLTVYDPVNAMDVQTACNTYTWINGITYTSSNNTATYVLTNNAGCDSTVTLNLTIRHSTAATDVQTACDTYTWINGITYTSGNNTATYVLTNHAGCDSTVTLNLTIYTVDNSVSVYDPMITANADGATYQWLDCNNSFSFIPGETAQSFTALTNGNFAVEVTGNGCTDTSVCVNVLTVGMPENISDGEIRIYPNPANSFITIASSGGIINGLKLINTLGQIIENVNVKIDGMYYTVDLSEVTNGIYVVEITMADHTVFNKKISIHK
ncbi:MAG TPA: choice-of-anchor Q domain-containing protein [Bacteroidales bacterium]|nr:choice-of-anchor Q domain-containing protein [Bacteroidales bacterium]